MVGDDDTHVQAQAKYFVNNKDGSVIDDLLCFIVYKMQVLPPDTIIQLVTSTYKVDDIDESKKKLFALCGTSRCISHKGEKKDSMNVKDMIKLLQERGTEIPTFVCKAVDLCKLPPISFDSVDVSNLLSQIQKLKDDVTMLTATVATQSEVINDHYTINSGLDIRLK